MSLRFVALHLLVSEIADCILLEAVFNKNYIVYYDVYFLLWCSVCVYQISYSLVAV